MKKFQKCIAIVLSCMMVVGVLAGCSSDKKDEPKKEEPQNQAAAGEVVGDYIVLDDSLDEEQYAVAFRKEDKALGMAVHDAMKAMIDDGKAAEISKKWFGEDILLHDLPMLNEDNEIKPDDKSLEKVKAAGKLVLGLDDTFPPMGFRDEKNNIVGFDIDMAKEVASRLGVELELRPIDWDAKELELSGGKVDCLWNGLSVTEERLNQMYMPCAYLSNRQIVIIPKDSDIKTIADLKDKVVTLQKGSSSLDALEKNPVAKEVKEIKQYPENVTAFMDLKAGRADAFVVDEVVGRYIIENQGAK